MAVSTFKSVFIFRITGACLANNSLCYVEHKNKKTYLTTKNYLLRTENKTNIICFLLFLLVF